MKAKIQAILEDVPQDEAAFMEVIKGIPDVFDRSVPVSTRWRKNVGPYENHLATLVRASALSYQRPLDEEGGDGRDGGITVGEREEGEVIDPRLMEAGIELNRLEGGTRGIEEAVDEMDIDADEGS